MKNFALALALIYLGATLIACSFGGGGGKTTLAFNTKISTLGAGQSYQFSINIQHDQHQGASWSLSPSTSQGGGTLVYTSPQPYVQAVYMAPPVPPSGGKVTITVTAANGSGVSDSDTFTITPAPGPVVTVTPVSFSATGGGARVTLNISVTNDAPDDSLSGAVGSGMGSFGPFVGTPGGGSYTVQYIPPVSVSQTTQQQVQIFSSLANSTPGTAVVTLNPGSGNGESQGLCQPQGNEGALSGPWTFLLNGYNVGFKEDIAGVFFADGKGGITSATLDIATEAQALQTYAIDPTTKGTGTSYSLDSSGHGCVALVSSSQPTVSRTFDMVLSNLNGAPYSGPIMEFDTANFPVRAIGSIEPGISSSSNATLNGSFVFGLAGSTPGAGAYIAGNMTFDGNGGINTAGPGLCDTDVEGIASGTRLPIAAGAYNLPAELLGGRGTFSIGTNGGIPVNGIFYVRQDGGLNILVQGTANSRSYLLGGSATPFNGPLTNTAISGYQLVAISGSGSAEIGIVNFNSTGGLTGNLWEYQGQGSFSTQSIAGSYTITDPAYGRVTFASSDWSYSLVAYMTGSTSGSDGYLFASGGEGGAETVMFQSATPTNYSAGDLKNMSAVFTQTEYTGATVSGYTTRIGLITFDGVGSFSGTYDEAAPDPSTMGSILTTNNPISGSYTINADGSGTFEQSTWPLVTRNRLELLHRRELGKLRGHYHPTEVRL